VGAHAALLQPLHVHGGRRSEHVDAERPQLELARRGTEDLARLLEVVDEIARFLVDQPAAPASLVPS
jgi:hypothetical protein